MGTKLFAKYVVKAELRPAAGALRVFRATQTGFDRDVELRLFERPADLESEEFQRFRRQLQILARLDHPSIARLLDVGYTETHAYYTVEYREAVPLAAILERIGGPMALEEVVEVARAIGSALAHIHDHGVTHRNVSARTVFFDGTERRPYIAEFSLLKDFASAQASFIALGGDLLLAATPTPELFAELPYDSRTDLFLFGSLLYHLATAVEPFGTIRELRGKSPDQVLTVPPPSARNRSLPPWFDDLVARLTARDPDARFPDAGSVLEAIDDAVGQPAAISLISERHGEIIADLRRVLDQPPPPRPPAPARRAPGPTRTPPRPAPRAPAPAARGGDATGRPLPWTAVIVVLLLLGGGGLFLAAGGAGSSQGAPATAAGRGDGNALMLGQIRDIVDSLPRSPVTRYNFIPRWNLLRAYARSLSTDDRAAVGGLDELDALKRNFYQDQGAACHELERLFRASLAAAR